MICVPVYPPGSRGVSIKGKQWTDRNVLTVGFADADVRLHSLVAEIANEISDACNIQFDFSSKFIDSTIRVSFIPGVGSYSYVGTDALLIPRNQETMNFSWLNPGMGPTNPTARAVILHEFGHALSLHHEQGHPHNNIPWDFPRLYEWFKRIGWTEEEVNRSYVNKFNEHLTQTSEYDPDSIMHYPINQQWTIGDFEIPWQSEFSQGDIEFLQTLYPFDHSVFLPKLEA